MPPRSLLRGFIALWAISGIVLLYASVATVVGALGAGAHAHPHAAVLGAIEAVAAVLFLVPRLMRVGAAGLLATIAIAFTVHAALGQWRGELLVFGAVVAFIAIHGPLSRAQWHAATSPAR